MGDATSRRPRLSLLALSVCRHSTANESISSDTSLNTSPSSSDSDLSSADVSVSEDSSSSDDTSTASSGSDETNTSFYKSAHWTSDGTTVVTSSWDNEICSFLIPEDLLDPRERALTLRPHWTLQLATPTNVVATAPYYDIRHFNSEHLLVASQDHPIQLHLSAWPPRIAQDDATVQSESDSHRYSPIGSYHFTSPTTEGYYPIHSLLWPFPGTHFYVGTRDLIAQFDITRNGDGPSSLVPTIPSRRHIRKGNGVGMRGTVSALSAQTTADNTPTGLIAAGTWTRWVGLYDMARTGGCTATWCIGEAAKGVIHTSPPANLGMSPPPTERKAANGATRPVKGIGGAGITQTKWSPCGRYLLLNERQSTGMLVYDIRGTNKVLGFLAGRDARTHQRMSCDVFQGSDSVGGFEVWGGAMDGTVKVWEGVGNTEGCQWPSWEFSAADGADGTHGIVAPSVGSVGLHHSGSVVATCAGDHFVPGEDHPSRSRTDSAPDEPKENPPMTTQPPPRRRMEESSLKLWRFGASAAEEQAESGVEPEHIDTAMADADEIEQHRQRVLSAIGAAEPELMEQSATESEATGKPEEQEAEEPEPPSLPAVETVNMPNLETQETAETAQVHEAGQAKDTAQNLSHVEEPDAMDISLPDVGSGDHVGRFDLPKIN